MGYLWTPPVDIIEALDRNHPLDRLYCAQQEIDDSGSLMDKFELANLAIPPAFEAIEAENVFEAHAREAHFELRDTQDRGEPIPNIGVTGLLEDIKLSLDAGQNPKLTILLEFRINAIFKLDHPDMRDQLSAQDGKLPLSLMAISALHSVYLTPFWESTT